MDLSTHRILVSRHVVFDGFDFPFLVSSFAASSSEYDTLLEADSIAPSVVPCVAMPPLASPCATPTSPALPHVAPTSPAPASIRAAPAFPALPRVTPTSPALPRSASLPFIDVASSSRFANPVHVYQRRGRDAALAPTHTEPPMYHPVALRRDPGHVHLMVT